MTEQATGATPIELDAIEHLNAWVAARPHQRGYELRCRNADEGAAAFIFFAPSVCDQLIVREGERAAVEWFPSGYAVTVADVERVIATVNTEGVT